MVCFHKCHKYPRRDIARIGTKPVNILSFRQALVQSKTNQEIPQKNAEKCDKFQENMLNMEFLINSALF